MPITLAHPALEEQVAPPRQPRGDDATRIAKALTEAHIAFFKDVHDARAAGNTYSSMRDAIERVTAAASDIDYKMTVTELYNLLTTGRR